MIWEKCAENGFSPGRKMSLVKDLIAYSRVRTEMVSENRVTDRDMSSDAFIETPVSEDAESGSKMLLSVQALFFKGP